MNCFRLAGSSSSPPAFGMKCSTRFTVWEKGENSAPGPDMSMIASRAYQYSSPTKGSAVPITVIPANLFVVPLPT